MGEQGKTLKVYKASAGSGKTFRLAVEYIALLVKNPTEYQHILAVTFTNKATGEMKQRILSQLYGISNALASSKGYVDSIIDLLKDEGLTFTPEQIKDECTKALALIVHDYSNFRIVTIDSFFQSIVRELANELGLSANITAELNADGVLEKAVDEIIDNLSLTSPEYDSLVKYIESRIEEDKNWKINESIIEFGKSILKENYLIHDNTVRHSITQKDKLDAYTKSLKAFLVQEQARLNQLINQTNSNTINLINNSSFASHFYANGIKFLNKDWSTISKWDDGNQDYIDKTEKWLKPSSKNNIDCLSFVDSTIIPQVQSFKDLLHTRFKLENDVYACTKHLYNLMIIGKIDEQMDRLNNESNHFLLAETAHFLRDVINDSNIPFIYEKTGTTINHIMIDEFQDTSTLQWANFKPLLTNCLDMGQSCLIVGDVKQSIYRFRNSDWKILNNIDNEKSELYQYIEPITHTTNHRSSPTVIKFNNHFFTHANEIIDEAYKKEHGHTCFELDTAYGTVAQDPQDKDNVYGYVKVENLLIPKKESGNTDTSDATELELHRIMLNVKDLLDAGVEQSDIAILVRKRFQASDICQYFEEHKDIVNVNIISDEAFKLESSPAVNMVIYALRSLSAQNDRLHLATLAFNYQTLVLDNHDIESNPSVIFIASTEQLLSHYLPSTYANDRKSLRYKSISEIVEYIYESFSLHMMKDQDAYMFYLHDIIESYSKDNLADIDSFLKKWDEELYKKTIPNGNTKGIRLMTIHKSKGLEFHSVIMPFCNWGLDSKDDTLLWCSLPEHEKPFSDMPLLPINYSYTKKSNVFIKEHDEEELLALVDNINVLYVGYTRAVHNLIIIASTKEGSNVKSADKLIIDSVESAIADKKNPLNMTIETQDNLVSYSIGTKVKHGGPDIEKKKKEKDAKVNPLTRQYDESSIRFVSNKTLSEFRQSNNSDLFISSQSKNEKAQCHAEKIRMISLGNLYHNTLQLIKTEKDIHSAILEMEKKGCFEQLSSRDKLEKDITALISNVSKQHPEWFSSDWKAINERAILFTDEYGNICTKRPDRVIVKDGNAIIIDYKTSTTAAIALPNGEISVPSDNSAQVAEYCSKLKEIGYKNVEGYLWYILSDMIYKVQ